MPDKNGKRNKWEKRYCNGQIMTILISIALLGFTNPTMSQTLSKSDAEKVLVSLNEGCHSFRWKCRIEKNIKMSDSDETASSSKQKSEFFEEYSVLYDVKGNRFCVEGSLCIPWVRGSSPTITKEISYSYDGETYMSWEKRIDEIPQGKNNFGTAIISSDNKKMKSAENFIKTQGASAGYGIGFPMQLTLSQEDFIGAMSVYDLISKWDSDRLLSLKETPDGKWMIEGLIVALNGNDSNIRFVCDIKEGGCVSEFVQFSNFSDNEYIENKMSVEFVKGENGQLLPAIVRNMYPQDKKMDVTTYSEIEINPTIHDDMFQITIPDNTFITDYITTKTYYKMGDKVDKDKAKAEDTNRYGLTDNNLIHNRGNGIRYILCGILALLVAYAVYRMIQRRKTS